MFNESRYTGRFEQMLTAEQVLARVGWLWAFNQSWAEGMGSHVGSVHPCDATMLTQVMTTRDDGINDILFHVTDQHIRKVKWVPKLENHFCDDLREFQHTSRPNPHSDGTTIAERLIAALKLPPDLINRRLREGELTINQIVIRSPGPVDRTQHYYIYERDGRTGLENLVPIILDCAPDFVPKLFKSNNELAPA